MCFFEWRGLLAVKKKHFWWASVFHWLFILYWVSLASINIISPVAWAGLWPFLPTARRDTTSILQYVPCLAFNFPPKKCRGSYSFFFFFLSYTYQSHLVLKYPYMLASSYNNVSCHTYNVVIANIYVHNHCDFSTFWDIFLCGIVYSFLSACVRLLENCTLVHAVFFWKKRYEKYF